MAKNDKEQLRQHRQILDDLKKSTSETITKVQEAIIRSEQIAQKIRNDQEKNKK